MARKILVSLTVAALALLAAPEPAHAGGFGYAGAGAHALGRGGAYAARVDDPMALFYNPAALARASGMQLSLNVNLGFFNACFDRAGTYAEYDGTPGPGHDPGNTSSGFTSGDDTPSGFGADGTPADSFDQFGAEHPSVCNSGPVGLVPQLAYSWRITPELGIGIGLIAPPAVGHTRWGRPSDGTIRADDGALRNADGRVPSPGRYNLVEEQLIIAFPTIGVAYRPHPAFSFGVAFGSGFGIFDFTTITRPTGGEEFGLDILSELHAVDRFIPRITASVHVVPHDSIDITAGFMWQDDVSAEGHIDLTSGVYADPADIDPDGPGQFPDAVRLDNVTLDAPQPWQASFGIRYADRISPRADDPSEVSRLTHRVEDSMSNERWDIEFNFTYEMNSRVDQFQANLPAGNTIFVQPFLDPEIPDTVVLPHAWKDQLSFSLGGDYNIMPGLASLSAGVSFETRGVETNTDCIDAYPSEAPGIPEGQSGGGCNYVQLDFMPFQRVGLHGGINIRAGNLDVSLSYAHFFQETITVSTESAGLPQVVAGDPGRGDGTVINAGTYTSSFDVFAIGINYHLR